MRAFVIAIFLALMGYGVPTLAQQSAGPSNAGQVAARSGADLTAKTAGIVRSRSFSSVTVTEIYGRR